MTSSEKITVLRELEKLGIVKQECPQPDWWVFSVLKPALLPKPLRKEFERLGEIRWLHL